MNPDDPDADDGDSDRLMNRGQSDGNSTDQSGNTDGVLRYDERQQWGIQLPREAIGRCTEDPGEEHDRGEQEDRSQHAMDSLHDRAPVASRSLSCGTGLTGHAAVRESAVPAAH